MIEVKPINPDVDAKVMRVFLKSIELLGGPRKLIEHRNLTWLPSLMTASYVVVYARDHNYTQERIAELVGSTKQTVQKILSADTSIVKQLLDLNVDEDKKTHIAGALAKLAYEAISRGDDEINIALEITKQTVRELSIDWAVNVLARLKGVDFPITKEALLEKLGGLTIKGLSIEEIANRIDYPINTPAELLHKIKEALQQ